MEKVDIELQRRNSDTQLNKSHPEEIKADGNKLSKLEQIRNNLIEEKAKIDLAENNNNIQENISDRRGSNIIKKCYSDKNLQVDRRKDVEKEERLKMTKTKNKNDLIEERRNVHKNFINFLTILHSALFVIIIILQFEVYLRYNIRYVLKQYFDIENYMTISGNFEGETYPESIFRGLAEKLQKNTFWFNDKKYEVISNVRITQRISKNDNFTSFNLILSDEIKQKIIQKQIKNNYDIKRYSGFNDDFEFNKDLPNGYKYQIQNSEN